MARRGNASGLPPGASRRATLVVLERYEEGVERAAERGPHVVRTGLAAMRPMNPAADTVSALVDAFELITWPGTSATCA